MSDQDNIFESFLNQLANEINNKHNHDHSKNDHKYDVNMNDYLINTFIESSNNSPRKYKLKHMMNFMSKIGYGKFIISMHIIDIGSFIEIYCRIGMVSSYYIKIHVHRVPIMLKSAVK